MKRLFTSESVTEGHPDGLALPDNGEDEKGRGFFSIPGVNGLSESHLGLLRDKKVIICFDQDRAGQKSAYGYSVIEYNGQRVDFINKIEEFKKIEKINFLNNSGVEYKEVVYQGISSKLEKAGIVFVVVCFFFAKRFSRLSFQLFSFKIGVCPFTKSEVSSSSIVLL